MFLERAVQVDKTDVEKGKGRCKSYQDPRTSSTVWPTEFNTSKGFFGQKKLQKCPIKNINQHTHGTTNSPTLRTASIGWGHQCAAEQCVPSLPLTYGARGSSTRSLLSNTHAYNPHTHHYIFITKSDLQKSKIEKIIMRIFK